MVIRAETRQERIWEGMRDGPGQAQLLDPRFHPAYPLPSGR